MAGQGSVPPGYRLGAASWRDLRAIAALEAAVFPEPFRLPALRRLWLSPGTRYLVARRDGLPVAHFGFRVSGPVARVLSNATDPRHRQRGLASALLRAGEAEARRAGARWLQGEVRRSNAPQLRLLAGLGWREVALCPRFFGNGEDAVLVLRVLP
jgi:ribosomal-protein-alanine N-acetyltransferase